MCFDDLGYSANTVVGLPRRPVLCQRVLLGDTVRATASRLREDATDTISMLTQALRLT